MFGRRVFASAPLPRHMWATMHIQNAAQAQRMLPSLAPLASSLGRCTNVLNSQAMTLARDGMASETGAASLDELFASRFTTISPSMLNTFLFVVGKFAISLNMPLVSFFEMSKQTLTPSPLRHTHADVQIIRDTISAYFRRFDDSRS